MVTRDLVRYAKPDPDLFVTAAAKIEIDIRDIRSVLDQLLPLLREGHSLILRSTIAPGTTEFVAGYIEKHRGLVAGRDISVAQSSMQLSSSG